MDSMPTEMDELRHRIMQLEIEEAAMKKETDTLDTRRIWRKSKKSLPSCASSLTT